MSKHTKILTLAAAVSVATLTMLGGTKNDVTGSVATIDVPVMEPTVTSTLRVAAATESANAVDAADVAKLPVAERVDVDTVWTPVAANLTDDVVGPSASLAAAPDFDASTPASVSPRDKMSGPVAALAAAGGNGLVDVVVRYTEQPELFDDEYVAALGGEVTRSYAALDMRAVRIPVASLEPLAIDSNVNWLSLDDEMRSLSVASREAANIPLTSSPNAAYEGLGVGVAILDTGVSNHADLGSNVLQFSFLNGAYPSPFSGGARTDGFGHGTHVAGILGGSGQNSSSQFKGSATDSTLLSLQVLNGEGGGSMSDVMAGLDWLLMYGHYYNIRVVNLSLGKGVSESNTTDPLVAAVERLVDAGMVVVVAAGNEGFKGSMTVTSPGNSRKVITVGSITDNGTGLDYSDDYVSSFSSTGPTVGDLVLKPDMLAPGNRVVAAIDESSLLARSLPGRLKACLLLFGCSDGYLELSGTSMATPLVAAAAARMLEKDPSLSPASVKARLMRSSRKIDVSPTMAGAGVLDVEAALNETGIVAGDALSPLMVPDESTSGIFVEDTAVLWGSEHWASGYIYHGGFGWTNGSDVNTQAALSASGYMWTDRDVYAKGYMWTDNNGVKAKGYMWTDNVESKSLLTDSAFGVSLNDDPPSQ